MKWPAAIGELASTGEPFVIVTVAGTRGSTPRETGAKMFVTRSGTVGTVGGGQLEYDCTSVACEWLREGGPARTFTRRFALGANCGQCCGGVAEILFEQIWPASTAWLGALKQVWEADQAAVVVTVGDSQTGLRKYIITADDCRGGDGVAIPAGVPEIARTLLANGGPAVKTSLPVPGNLQVMALFEPVQHARFEIVLFGAGHVGSALVAALAPLPCAVVWIDSRPAVFPERVPDNVTPMPAADPPGMVGRFGPGRYFLVMTHSHAMDQEICNRILARDDFSYCGLIGSRAKRRQFDKRFRDAGLSDRQIGRLTCPIGIGGIEGKRPAEIAVAVTAQLLQHREAELARLRQPGSAVKRQAGR